MGYYTNRSYINNGILNQSRLYFQISSIEFDAQERRGLWRRRLHKIKEEHADLTEPDQVAWSSRISSTGELQSVRSLHWKCRTCRKDGTGWQAVQVMRHHRKEGTSRRRENLRKVNTFRVVQSLNKIEQGVFPFSLSKLFYQCNLM